MIKTELVEYKGHTLVFETDEERQEVLVMHNDEEGNKFTLQYPTSEQKFMFMKLDQFISRIIAFKTKSLSKHQFTMVIETEHVYLVGKHWELEHPTVYLGSVFDKLQRYVEIFLVDFKVKGKEGFFRKLVRINPRAIKSQDVFYMINYHENALNTYTLYFGYEPGTNDVHVYVKVGHTL